ncbi:MAG: hypothetical protein IT269_06850, partial [Saprospiraceae bacterium]|nr:hypothetical protein [Saprospiraceae bacterium]
HHLNLKPLPAPAQLCFSTHHADTDDTAHIRQIDQMIGPGEGLVWKF